MRIIQTILGIIMIFTGIYIYIQLQNKKLLKKINILPLIVLIAFGSMALYNGLTSTCSISTIFEDYLN
jgi:hypothetical protein